MSANALPASYPTLEDINRHRLMDAAVACMQENPLNKITMQHIAERSGIVRQTVYNYYSNKNELLAATFEREGLKLAEEVSAYIRSIPLLENKWVEGFVYVVENFAKNPVLAKVIEPGSDFLATVGHAHYPFAAFGQLAFADVFAAHPKLMVDAEEISELWTRNAMSFLSMPGPEQRTHEELAAYVRRRLLPGLGL